MCSSAVPAPWKRMGWGNPAKHQGKGSWWDEGGLFISSPPFAPLAGAAPWDAPPYRVRLGSHCPRVSHSLILLQEHLCP